MTYLPGIMQIGMMEIQHAQGRSTGLQTYVLPILRRGHSALLTPLTLPSTALTGVRPCTVEHQEPLKC